MISTGFILFSGQQLFKIIHKFTVRADRIPWPPWTKCMAHTKHGGVGAGRGEEERNSLGMEIRESRDCLGPESEPMRFP